VVGDAAIPRCGVAGGRVAGVVDAALIVEASRKAGVLWVAAPGHDPVPAWQVWKDGASYLLTGPGEQTLPGLPGAAECEVTARSTDTGGRLASWRAMVTVIEPGSEEWQGIRPALDVARLNGHPDWSAVTVLRLTPAE
jgi:hypothetical protein